MSENGWTKGPWSAKRAIEPSDGEYDWGIGAEIDGKRYCIAETFGRVAPDVRPNAEANARLIAAAPALAEAGERSAITLEEAANIVRKTHPAVAGLFDAAAKFQRDALRLAKGST